MRKEIRLGNIDSIPVAIYNKEHYAAVVDRVLPNVYAIGKGNTMSEAFSNAREEYYCKTDRYPEKDGHLTVLIDERFYNYVDNVTGFNIEFEVIDGFVAFVKKYPPSYFDKCFKKSNCSEKDFQNNSQKLGMCKYLKKLMRM